ncbi:MAG: hypothetical protein FD181_1697 [Prolixibacteraceae bacterium]|nr:MAG: hypothetical protein FD181_1697 [Prolixibacteraceae bacterium]
MVVEEEVYFLNNVKSVALFFPKVSHRLPAGFCCKFSG